MRRRRRRPTSIKETIERLAVARLRRDADVRPERLPAIAVALADPKDKLEVFTAVQRAGELMVSDESRRASQALESALVQEPGDAAGTADAGIVLHRAGTHGRRPKRSSIACSRTIRRASRA